MSHTYHSSSLVYDDTFILLSEYLERTIAILST